MINAIGYVRCSTDRQEESLDQQRRSLESFAKSKGWKLKAIYADDAISGSELKRHGLDQLLNAAKADDVEVVLAWDRNRLARPKDAVDGLLLERELMQAGKRVIYAATGQESDGTFASGLISYVEHYQNGDYLRKLSRDTMRGTVERARRGCWPGGPIPFGFDRLIMDGDMPRRIVRSTLDGGQVVLEPTTERLLETLPKGKSHKKQEHETCTLIPSEPSRVRALQHLFTAFAEGLPTRRLRDELNAAGFRTSRGGYFTVPTIIPMLENPAYVGRCIYNRRTLSKWHRYREGASVERQDEGVERRPQEDWIICDEAWPALVEIAVFDAVQERRARSKASRCHYRGNAMKSDYLLTGLIFCGVCGGKLTGMTQKSGKGYKTRYYTCSRHSAGHKHECPKRYTVPADVVEQHILTIIGQDLLKLRNDKQLHTQVQDQLKRLSGGRVDAHEQLQRRLADLDQQLATLRDHLLSLAPDTAKSLGVYDQADRISEERTRVEAESASVAIAQPTPPSIAELRKRIAREFDHLGEVIASGTIEEKRELIACYVRTIKADPDHQTVHIGLYPTLLSQIVVVSPPCSWQWDVLHDLRPDRPGNTSPNDRFRRGSLKGPPQSSNQTDRTRRSGRVHRSLWHRW